MRKNILVFCCVTLLTALFFGCNGVPALAASMKVKVTSVETNECKVTEKTTAKKKIDKKKAKKKKKSQKAVKIENYIKNGKFNYKSYGKAIGADRVDGFEGTINFLFKEGFFAVLSTDQQDAGKNEYFIAIGYLNKEDYIDHVMTYFMASNDWGNSVETQKGVSVSENGIKDLYKVASYMLKHPDPYEKPKIDGMDWRDEEEF